MPVILIADSGATKCEWRLVTDDKVKSFTTAGISPYFLNAEQIAALLIKELLPKIKKVTISHIHFYGTGLANIDNANTIRKVLKNLFPKTKTEVQTDILAAARALCGRKKGLACNLGTGTICCYYDGKKIVKTSPGLGYILGDEGSGTYLGKKVIQYYLYNTFDEELRVSFEKRFQTTQKEILDSVYKKPLANRYLASFAIFLAENRGHYMIENIIEDGLNDFFFTHLYKFRESWTMPIHFIGSIAFGFRDVLKELCNTYELELGKVIKSPMQGLIEYHR